ncbi:uncharacterized protein LOC134338096 [Mobula hypostoma]|uniref:uncharacterized protein LOC134338096 n=1 Tax=Mobula hypostoma TaxID=723540 RepID=UPI002FC2E058
MNRCKLSALLLLGLSAGGAAVAFSLWARRKNARKGPLRGEAELGAEAAQQEVWGTVPSVEQVEPESGRCSGLAVILETDLEYGSSDPEFSESEDEMGDLCPGENNLYLQAGYSELSTGNLNIETGSQNMADNMEERDKGKQHGISPQEQPGGKPGPESALRNFLPDVASPTMTQVGENKDTGDKNMINENHNEGMVAEEKVENENKDNVIVTEEKVRCDSEDQEVGGEEQVKNDEESPDCGTGDAPMVLMGERRVPLSRSLESVGEKPIFEQRRSMEVRSVEHRKKLNKRGDPPRGQKFNTDWQRCGQPERRDEEVDFTIYKPVAEDMTLRSGFGKEESVAVTNDTEVSNPNSFIKAEDLFVDEGIRAMRRGSHLLKVRSPSWMRFRLYKLQKDYQTVWYSSEKICKWARNQTFSIYDIEEVRAGHHSEVTSENRSDYNFSIIFKGREKNLDLVANSAMEAQYWIDGLNNLKMYYTRRERREQNSYMVRYQLEGPNRVKAYDSCPDCSRAARSSIAAGLKVPPATSSWMR